MEQNIESKKLKGEIILALLAIVIIAGATYYFAKGRTGENMEANKVNSIPKENQNTASQADENQNKAVEENANINNNDSQNNIEGNINVNIGGDNTGQNNEAQDNNQAAAVREFNLSAKPFEFSQKEIRVKKGDKVRINLTIAAGFHDWAIDEFNAKTRQMGAGESDSVEFTADKIGTFEYYCSVGNHRQMGMVGNLIVE
jgi:plastocyanin